MALTYYGLINLLFVAMLVLHDRMLRAVRPYFEIENFNEKALLYFIIAGTLILLLCNAGLLLMSMKRKGGFYLYLSGAVILLIIDSFFLQFDLIRYLLNTGFIFILGVLHFTGKIYGKPAKFRKNKRSVTE